MRNRITVVACVVMLAGILPQLASGYQLGNRWTTTATSGSGLGQGDATTITWSIIPDGTTISGGAGEPSSGSNLINFLDTYIGSAAGSDLTQRPWFSIFDNSFGRMAEVSGLTAVYEANDDGQAIDGSSAPYGQTGVRGDVRIGGHSIDGGTPPDILAYNYFPNHGDMVIDTDNSSFYGQSANNYRAMRNVVMHEHGHGVGLEHVESNNASFLMEPYINTSFDGPQFDDILGLHRHYGDANEKANNEAGNDTAANATSLGTIVAGSGTVELGKDATDAVVASTDVDFVSIDDNSDIDYFSFTVGNGVTVDLLLTPLGPTYNQGPQGGGQSSFAASNQSDLALELLDTDGTSSLGLSDIAGLGWSESLTGIALDAGTYFIKITGDQNTAQMYGLDLTVTPEPATMSLLALGGLALLRRRRK